MASIWASIYWACIVFKTAQCDGRAQASHTALLTALAAFRLLSLTSQCPPGPSVFGADLGGTEYTTKAM